MNNILHLPKVLKRRGGGRHSARRPLARPAGPARKTFPQLLAACFSPESRPAAPFRASAVSSLAWKVHSGDQAFADWDVAAELASLLPEVGIAERGRRLELVVAALGAGADREDVRDSIALFFDGSGWTVAA